MASSYLRVNLVFNYCMWTSQLSKLGSEIHLCSFMLFLLLSSSWTEDSVKGWMIRAEIFFGRAEEMAASLCLHCFLLLYVHTLLFWLQEQSKVNDLMDLHLDNSIPHSLRSWLHYCLLARNTDTAARYWPCKPNKTSFCFLEQKLSSFIIAPAWLYKSVGKNTSILLYSKSDNYIQSYYPWFTQLPKATLMFPLISLNHMQKLLQLIGFHKVLLHLNWLFQRRKHTTKDTSEYDEVALRDALC